MAEQVLQGELPPIGVDTPSPLWEKEAKVEKRRSIGLWQWGQKAGSFASATGRSNSNFNLQWRQKYSYMGTFTPPQMILRIPWGYEALEPPPNSQGR